MGRERTEEGGVPVGFPKVSCRFTASPLQVPRKFPADFLLASCRCPVGFTASSLSVSRSFLQASCRFPAGSPQVSRSFPAGFPQVPCECLASVLHISCRFLGSAVRGVVCGIYLLSADFLPVSAAAAAIATAAANPPPPPPPSPSLPPGRRRRCRHQLRSARPASSVHPNCPPGLSDQTVRTPGAPARPSATKCSKTANLCSKMKQTNSSYIFVVRIRRMNSFFSRQSKISSHDFVAWTFFFRRTVSSYGRCFFVVRLGGWCNGGSCRLQAAGCWLQAAACRLLDTACKLQAARCTPVQDFLHEHACTGMPVL